MFGRLKAYWTDVPTWRGFGYLLARFPIGMFTFSVAVSVYGAALGLIAAPLLAPLDADGLELGIWQPDSVLEGFALVPLGLVLLVAAGWISEGMAAISREWPAGAPADSAPMPRRGAGPAASGPPAARRRGAGVAAGCGATVGDEVALPALPRSMG